MRQSARRILVAVWAGTLILLCALGLYLFRELLSGMSLPSIEQIEQPPQPAKRLQTVSLYFGATSGRGLAREQRQIRVVGKSTSEVLQLVLQELIQGPASVLVRTVPPETTVNSVFLLDTGMLVIDFGKEIQAYHPGSCLSELMTVYSIVNTLTANFNEISSVRFLVEGSEIDTLTEHGHVDLAEPVLPDQTWVYAPGELIE